MVDADEPTLVSVIIVVLNGEAYLEEAIESVLSQTLDAWELLIVDDGSSDRTAEIADGYATRHPGRIRILRHPGGANLGIAASRNRGIASALGPYVAFLDADDVWLPQKLSEQVAIMDADPALGMAYGRTLIWYSWDVCASESDHYYDLGVEPEFRYEPPALLEVLLENRCQSPTTCNAVIRRDLFDAIGTFDARARGMFEDLSFFGKALATSPVYVAGRTWAKYRQHGSSCTALSALSGGDEAERVRALTRLDRELARYNVSRSVHRVIRRARNRAAADLARRWIRVARRRIVRGRR